MVATTAMPLCPDKRGGRRCLCHGNFLFMRNGSGWIRPIDQIDHPTIWWNKGQIYLAEGDVHGDVALTPGETVVFYLYVDVKGLGAEKCMPIWHPDSESPYKSQTYGAKTSNAKVSINLDCFCDSDDDDASDSSSDAGDTAVPTELPSVGSANHAEGTCKRCSFFPKGRCVNGSSCEFCHFEHEKRTKRNKRKHKKEAAAAEQAAALHPEFKHGVYEYSAESDDLLKHEDVLTSPMFDSKIRAMVLAQDPLQRPMTPSTSNGKGDITPTTIAEEFNTPGSDYGSNCSSPPAVEREPFIVNAVFGAPPGLPCPAPPPGLEAC